MNLLKLADLIDDFAYQTNVEKNKNKNHILKYFDFGHLSDDLKPVSYLFFNLAHDLSLNLEPSAELSACLRKILEAKDCAVRAMIEKK